MEKKITEVADLLYANTIDVSRVGYPLHSWQDWYDIAEEWVSEHPDWTADELFIGIKYYNYKFPKNVSRDMVENASGWN